MNAQLNYYVSMANSDFITNNTTKNESMYFSLSVHRLYGVILVDIKSVPRNLHCEFFFLFPVMRSVQLLMVRLVCDFLT